MLRPGRQGREPKVRLPSGGTQLDGPRSGLHVERFLAGFKSKPRCLRAAALSLVAGGPAVGGFASSHGIIGVRVGGGGGGSSSSVSGLYEIVLKL